jgi:4-diphosphocytidyl-2-C-methyl-D-erythritol kinase
MLATRAPAKINLTLRVHRRQADGYHELSSLVAFAGVGDELSLEPGGVASLTISGPHGAGLDSGPDNLVLRAAKLLAERRPGLRAGRFHLVKRLPVASGIGGGSADAAAALRLLARLNGIAANDPALHDAALAAGADVPVCLESRARRMAGIGETLHPPLRLPSLFAVLANPGRALSTAAVFAALGLKPGQAMAHGASGDGVASWRSDWPEAADQLIDAVISPAANDLEAAAIRLEPMIGDVLTALAAEAGCRLARMSGSGATCFGLFGDCRESAAAAKALQRRHPGWWVKSTVLR